jgi:tagatose-1,6-bisphosphate aldolase non-catalytic subunit AgaZ/GatZ
MNSYDLKSITDHMAAVTDHVEAIANSGTGEALSDVYGVLESIDGTLSAARNDSAASSDALVNIAAQLTQISNTLARTMGREETRFVTVTRLSEGIPAGEQSEIVGVAHIERAFPREGVGTYIETKRSTFLVGESLAEILTMINAGAYVPPF